MEPFSVAQPVTDSPNPSFVFVGPPKVGKTVYFTCAIDLLKRRLLNKPDKGIFLQTDDPRTLTRHKDALSKMQRGQWPDKSIVPLELFYLLERRTIWFGKRLWTTYTKLVYHDYPGEVFDLAFSESRADLRHYEEEAEKFKRDLTTAKGIFLIIDAPDLHHGNDDEFELQLFRLVKFLDESRDGRKRRVAVVFTKKDLFHGDSAFDPKEELRRQHPDSWVSLNRNETKFFFVSAVSKAFVDPAGIHLPPKGYNTSQSENLIEPIVWALKLPL